MLRPWTVITLLLAGAIVSLGAAIEGGRSGMSWVGTPLIVLGASCAAVCVTLWVVCVLDPRRRAAQGDSLLIRRLVGELVEAAGIAESRGILALPARTLSGQTSLFAAGAKMLVDAEPAESIRKRLASLADHAAESQGPRRAGIRLACDAIPLLALSLALTMMAWAVIAVARGSSMGTLLPLALLGSVYGAFAIAAVAVEVGDRTISSAAEHELAAALVIETLTAIRAGEGSERVAARLRGLAPDGTAHIQAAPLRKAA